MYDDATAESGLFVGQRLEMCKRHQSALQECQSRTHQLKLLEREHAEEKKVGRLNIFADPSDKINSLLPVCGVDHDERVWILL